MAFNFSKILEGLGFPSGEVSQVQLGPGVVGNTTTAVVAAIIATAAEAYFLREQPAVMFGVMGMTLILTITYLIGTWKFAERQPDLALMGGAELLQLRRLQMGAKNPEIINATSIPVVGTSSQAGGADDAT